MINDLLIKVCGMKETENIREVEKLGIDMMGFVFYPNSMRYMHTVPGYLPSKCKRIGVFVNEPQENVRRIVRLFSLDYVQLHGHEPADYCNNIRDYDIKVIKVFSIANREDLEKTTEYNGICDYYLFDTKCENYGGSGKLFDWELLSHYKGDTPFLLSGGLATNSINALRNFTHPQLAGYDINSKFEIAPGLKNVEYIKQFLENIKN